MRGTSSAKGDAPGESMIPLLAQRAYLPGRIDPLKVGAKRLDNQLIPREFLYILARFFACAIVES
jgi:hypothetical protein